MGEIFKERSELEEFFKNLGIEYRFSCYYEKNGEGCHLLGDYMSRIENDLIRSSKVWKDNCNDNQFGRSCTQFGSCLVLGKGVEKDVSKAINYFSKGCELDDNEGCFYAGQMLSGSDPQYRGQFEPNINKSVQYLQKGCEMSKNTIISAECCYYIHSFYMSGKYGCPQDVQKAFKYAVKGCELENTECCNNLSQMYDLGIGTQKDEVLAKKYRNKTLETMDQINRQTHIETQRT